MAIKVLHLNFFSVRGRRENTAAGVDSAKGGALVHEVFLSLNVKGSRIGNHGSNNSAEDGHALGARGSHPEAIRVDPPARCVLRKLFRASVEGGSPSAAPLAIRIPVFPVLAWQHGYVLRGDIHAFTAVIAGLH